MFEVNFYSEWAQPKNTTLIMFFKMVKKICQYFDKAPDELFIIFNGLDTGDEDPPFHFEPFDEDIKNILKKTEKYMFGFSVYFRIRQGRNKINAHCVTGAYFKFEGDDLFINSMKRLCKENGLEIKN